MKTVLVHKCRGVVQAPAWQPPLPQEAPKAPEVKAEPQQQVMSEYERFMAEVRWPPAAILPYTRRLASSSHPSGCLQDSCTAGTDASLSMLTCADGAGAPVNLHTDDIHPGVMTHQGWLLLTRGQLLRCCCGAAANGCCRGAKESAASVR